MNQRKRVVGRAPLYEYEAAVARSAGHPTVGAPAMAMPADSNGVVSMLWIVLRGESR